MSGIAKVLIFAALISLVCGIIFKLFQIDLTQYFDLYPFRPGSFLNFANTVLLFAIALLLVDRRLE